MGDYCENCGAYIPTGAKRCLSCGKTVEEKKQQNAGVVFPPPVTYWKDGAKSVIDLRPLTSGHKADLMYIDRFTLHDVIASVKDISMFPWRAGRYKNIYGETITVSEDEFVKITLEIIGAPNK